MDAVHSLVASCTAMVTLTFVVGLRLYQVRIAEMRKKLIPAQAVALSVQRAHKLTDSRASDNYNHLFELPILFYFLCIAAIAADHIPGWLPELAWLFVALRVLHSVIQCTYNNVLHRFSVFLTGFLLIFAMWLAFAVSLIGF